MVCRLSGIRYAHSGTSKSDSGIHGDEEAESVVICFLFVQYLPKEELYSPPLNIRILDKRNFGRLPMVGTHIIKSLKDFHVSSVLTPEEKAALKGTSCQTLTW